MYYEWPFFFSFWRLFLSFAFSFLNLKLALSFFFFSQTQIDRPSSPKKLKTEIHLLNGQDNLFSGHLNRFSNLSPIAVEEHLNLEDFLEVYKNNCCPVIIRGMLEDWPALQKDGDHQWSVEYLKKVTQGPILYNNLSLRVV